MSAIVDPTTSEAAGGPDGTVTVSVPGDGQVAVDGPVPAGAAELRSPASSGAEAARGAPIGIALPELPGLRLRAVHGRYRGTSGLVTVELRLDVDGPRPMGKVSGDIFVRVGATSRYGGSFIVDDPQVAASGTELVITGTGRFTSPVRNRRLRVTVRRVAGSSPPPPATLEFLSARGAIATTYTCAFESPWFRSVELEQDSVAGAVPFVAYDTAALPGPDPDRVLSVAAAYREAGIDLQLTGEPNVVPISDAGQGTSPTWSDSELHAAMVNHFSLHADRPQWRLWLLVATAHDGGYRGIMFDYSGSHQRQGAAVFWDAIGGADAASQRAALRTYVHELGHALNLLHSWDKDDADPPQPLGPNGGLGELSWMNYVQNYDPGNGGPSGSAAYWAAFPFQFVDNEVVHLRHGFRDSVIPGAKPFGTGGAEVDPAIFAEPAQDGSGLALELRARGAYAFGEPVVVELKLSATDTRGVRVHGHLHPKDDFTRIAIRQPSGRVVTYRPLLRHCIDEDAPQVLDPGRAQYDSAYIGFGRDGFLFEQPGLYELRAQHVAADGSRIVSNVVRLRVRSPLTAADEEAGELMLGTEQGQLLALLGSDSPVLAGGNAAFEELLERHPDHRLATYARLAHGVNALRDFKHLPPEADAVAVRPAQPESAAASLRSVQAASTADAGVDNITLNMVIRKHACAEAMLGDVDRAAAILDGLPDVFAGRGVRPAVVDVVRAEAAEYKEELLGGA